MTSIQCGECVDNFNKVVSALKDFNADLPLLEKRCVRRGLASPSGLWVQSLSLSFPLPRRTAPFLLPRIALYPQSAWWRGCGGLLDGGCGAAAAAARRGGVCDWATKSKQSMSITSMQTYLHYKN